jgi:hypothetical protein
MTIPTYLEQLIHQGKAEAKVYTGGLSRQCEIGCPQGSYLVIYGYYYKPFNSNYGETYDALGPTYPELDYANAVQYVNFSYDNKFASFVHSIDLNPVAGVPVDSNKPIEFAATRILTDIETQERSCYLVSTTNVAISITKLTFNDVGSNTATLVADNSIKTEYGYAGMVSEIRISSYITTGIQQRLFLPLTPEKTEKTYGFVPIDTNQAYTNPAQGGEIELVNSYAGGLSALGKARMPVLNVLYVQVNEQKPSNLI